VNGSGKVLKHFPAFNIEGCEKFWTDGSTRVLFHCNASADNALEDYGSDLLNLNFGYDYGGFDLRELYYNESSTMDLYWYYDDVSYLLANPTWSSDLIREGIYNGIVVGFEASN
jgi:hypothetical protein